MEKYINALFEKKILTESGKQNMSEKLNILEEALNKYKAFVKEIPEKFPDKIVPTNIILVTNEYHEQLLKAKILITCRDFFFDDLGLRLMNQLDYDEKIRESGVDVDLNFHRRGGYLAVPLPVAKDKPEKIDASRSTIGLHISKTLKDFFDIGLISPELYEHTKASILNVKPFPFETNVSIHNEGSLYNYLMENTIEKPHLDINKFEMYLAKAGFLEIEDY